MTLYNDLFLHFPFSRNSLLQHIFDRFNKDFKAFKSYRGLDQISLDELGLTASDLVDMENKLAKRFEDIQTTAPKVYNPDVLSLVRELARKEAEK